VIAMATIAFGPSGFGFSVVLAIAAFALMRYRYRFSLKTFLIATTLLAMWLGLKVKFDLAHERAMTIIANAGGKFSLHDRTPNFPWGVWSDRYDISLWQLKQPASHDVFRSLTDLRSPSLHWLDLENSGITDKSVCYLRKLPGLEFLSLANQTYFGGARIPTYAQNAITDVGLDQLSGLTNLSGIDLSGTDVTDHAFEVVATMPKLMWIKLDGTRVTGINAARLSGLRDLSNLELNGCPISADGIKELSSLRQLGSLGVTNSGLKDSDLDALSILPTIRLIRLRKNIISSEAKNRFLATHANCKIE
jgi:hypothetical protein